MVCIFFASSTTPANPGFPPFLMWTISQQPKECFGIVDIYTIFGDINHTDMQLISDYNYNAIETLIVEQLESLGFSFTCYTSSNDVGKCIYHDETGLMFHIPNSLIYDESEEMFNTFSIPWDKWSTGRGMYTLDCQGGFKVLVALLTFGPHADNDTDADMDNWEQTLRPFIQSHDYSQL